MGSLENLNNERVGTHKKQKVEENFLETMNNSLFNHELELYQDYNIDHPFIFVIGLPRSGTTLLSQFIANTFQLGFINNIAARFYKTPLHGIRFSKTVLGDAKHSNYSSNYARTSNLSDIHEFGYFWRYWLKKESLEDIAHYKENETKIDWVTLRKCLSSIQHDFGMGFTGKNIFGGYHMPKICSLLPKCLFVFIERDELDVGYSILQARKNYYGENLNTWWSYAPPQVLELLSLEPIPQIAGQISYLKKFYEDEFTKLNQASFLKIRYLDLCTKPAEVAQRIQNHVNIHFDYPLEIDGEIPDSFHFRTYDHVDSFKIELKQRIDEFG